MPMDVLRNYRYEMMRPGELEAAVRMCPLALAPVGTLEWHGRHLPLGLDALKAHAICLRIAEKSGGVVLPPNYFSCGGMLFPWTFRYDPGTVFRIIHQTLRRLKKHGFKIIFIITGHYPVHHVLLLMAAAEMFMAFNDAVAVALPEFSMAGGTGYNGDHAAKWETSLMMELFPDLVDADELSKFDGLDGLRLAIRGIHGENPAETASRELGAKTLDEIVSGFASLAQQLLESADKNIARETHRRAVKDFLKYETKNIFDNLRL
jgi:creatinine amidohydrolase